MNISLPSILSGNACLVLDYIMLMYFSIEVKCLNGSFCVCVCVYLSEAKITTYLKTGQTGPALGFLGHCDAPHRWCTGSLVGSVSIEEYAINPHRGLVVSGILLLY